MKKLTGIVFALTLAVAVQGVVVAPAQAQSTSTASLMETLKTLLAKVAELQAEMAKVRGEVQEARSDVRAALKDGLKEGMTDEDIKEIQELLATDPSIYPEGLVTGYYGNLTKNALKRFQNKHSLTETGVIDDETRDLLEEYLGERFNGKVPPGLLRAPGIMKKVQDGICEQSGKAAAWGLFCKDHKSDDDDEVEDNEGKIKRQCLTARTAVTLPQCEKYISDSEDDEEEFEVEVEIENGTTTVSFTYEGEDYSVEVKGSTRSAVIIAVANELSKSVSALDKNFVKEIKKELAAAIAQNE